MVGIITHAPDGGTDLRLSHPNLYRTMMTYALLWTALGVNFLVFTPTFLIFGLPNALWASIFLALAAAQIVLLNFYRRLRAARMVMALSMGYSLLLAFGTGEPWVHGKGSLQLPIFYFVVTVLQVWTLREPFVNPLTRRDDP